MGVGANIAADASAPDEEDALYKHLQDVLRRGGYWKLEYVGRRPLRLSLSAIVRAFAEATTSPAVTVIISVISLLTAFEGIVGLELGRWFTFGGFVLVSLILGLTFLVAYEPATLPRMFRALGQVLTTAQLVFALIVLVVFALVFTAEVWQAASTGSTVRLLVLAAVVIIPELVLLRHQLVAGIYKTFERVGREISDRLPSEGSKKIAEEALEEAKQLGGMKAKNWLEANADAQLQTFYRERWPKSDAARTDLAEKFSSQLSGTLKRRITARLLSTVVVVALVAGASIYLIASLAVTSDVASHWAQLSDVPFHSVAGVLFPGGPYVNVAVLLGVLASGVFLGFIITNEQLSDQLRNAYLEEPVRAVWLLGAPCQDVAERINKRSAPAAGPAAR